MKFIKDVHRHRGLHRLDSVRDHAIASRFRGSEIYVVKRSVAPKVITLLEAHLHRRERLEENTSCFSVF